MTLADLRALADRQALITVEEAAEVLGWRRSATYAAVRRGELPTLRRGRLVFVRVPALLALIDAGPTAGTDGAALATA